MPGPNRIDKPTNSTAMSARAYGMLRSQLMAPPEQWSDVEFNSVFGPNANGNKQDTMGLIASTFASNAVNTYSLVLEVPENLNLLEMEPLIDSETDEQAFTEQIIPASSYESKTWDEIEEEWVFNTIEIPEETITTLLWGDYVIGNDIVYLLGELFTRWPSGISTGTKPVDGKKIINATLRIPTTKPLSFIKAFIVTFELDEWVIMGLKTFDAPEQVGEDDDTKWVAKFYVPLSDDVIPYIDKVLEEQTPIYDDSEPPVIIGYKPITQFPFTTYSDESKWG